MRKIWFLLFFTVFLLSNSLFAGITWQEVNNPRFGFREDTTGKIFENYGELSLRNEKDERLKSRKIVNGDMEVIGASVVKMQHRGYDFDLTSIDSSFKPVVYENEANFRTNSATATFDLSDKTGTIFEENGRKKSVSLDGNITADKVVFARLYWSGIIAKYNASDPAADIYGFDTIKFKTPDNKTYTLEAKPEDAKWTGSYYDKRGDKHLRFQYMASVDVTDIVKGLGNLKLHNTSFSAGDIKTSVGEPRNISAYSDNKWWVEGWQGLNYHTGIKSPNFGGWALLIVYDFPKDQYPAWGAGNRPEATIHPDPKSVKIYDGFKPLQPLQLNGKSFREEVSISHFDGFYTPPRGEINSVASILAFGAAREIKAESVKIRSTAYGGYRTEFTDIGDYGDHLPNPVGSQFNSSISKYNPKTKRNEHANKDKNGRPKIYNASMDLDTYKITNTREVKRILPRATSVDLKIGVQVVKNNRGGGQGDEASIGLVAFSTDTYIPDVCYTDDLEVRSKYKKGENDFKTLDPKSKTKIQVKKDDTLRLKLTILNRGDESAEMVGIKVTPNSKYLSYVENSSRISADVSRSTNFDLKDEKYKNDDNTKLQEYQNGTLRFHVGKDADNTRGGTLSSNNKAQIQFDTTLKAEFKDEDYLSLTAKFSNKALGLELDGLEIKRCDARKYNLEVIGIANKIVNDRYGTPGNSSENFFTQLVGRSFDAKLINRVTRSENDEGSVENFNLDVNERLIIDVVERSKCQDGQNLMQKPPFVFDRKYELGGGSTINQTSIIDLKGIVINKAYKDLAFRLHFTDDLNNTLEEPICVSDGFSVRPKEFRFYNSDNNTENFGNLIGGKIYTNVWLKAVDFNGAISDKYNNGIDFIRFEKRRVPAGCNNSFAFLNDHSMSTDFINGRGQLKQPRNTWSQAGVNVNFIYPNIGYTGLSAKDDTWTQVDQPNDCIADSATIDKDAEGKIGCEIHAGNDIELRFVPNDILIDNFRVANFGGGLMTYMSGNANMSASTNFNITARLHENSGRAPATLYTSGCYANNVSFTMNLTSPIEDLTDNNGNIIADNNIRLAQSLNDIRYFAPSDPNLVQNALNPAVAGNSAYTMNSAGFNNGVAPVSVPFNFARAVNIAKNPFRATSNNFNFAAISDGDGVAGAPYAQPTTITNADFYYGRVYAPNVQGPRERVDASVYYGVFCSGCNTAKYSIAQPALPVPGINNWFINSSHTSLNQGTMGATAALLRPNTTVIAAGDPLNNGVQTLILSSTVAPAQDTIAMRSSPWLVFDPLNAAAVTNNFNVTFLPRVQAWGGRALGNDGQDVGVGDTNAIGIQNSAPKTNKRLSW